MPNARDNGRFMGAFSFVESCTSCRRRVPAHPQQTERPSRFRGRPRQDQAWAGPLYEIGTGTGGGGSPAPLPPSLSLLVVARGTTICSSFPLDSVTFLSPALSS